MSAKLKKNVLSSIPNTHGHPTLAVNCDHVANVTALMLVKPRVALLLSFRTMSLGPNGASSLVMQPGWRRQCWRAGLRRARQLRLDRPRPPHRTSC